MSWTFDPVPEPRTDRAASEFPAKSAGNSWQSCLSLGFDQSRADGIPHHAGGLMHSQLLQDPAAMRVGGLVADTQLDSGFLGGVPAGDQHQHLALALGQREYQPYRFPIRCKHKIGRASCREREEISVGAV